MSRHLDEALVETEVVTYRVLPALLVLAVVGKVGHDKLVDAVERELLVGAVADGHHDERVVAVRRLVARRVLLLRRLLIAVRRGVQ